MSSKELEEFVRISKFILNSGDDLSTDDCSKLIQKQSNIFQLLENEERFQAIEISASLFQEVKK